ncbi:hypothetical protein [Hymenobacter sp. BT559]|uniref:hypothetical protein n=1 Tax=Hymenobacter sp. BT559 TaxID=2795729 RepID=UPI0018EB7CE6|nr:hypothetical protein [Hymenobacter sp. BT559]MBJ6145758.1 hypothetical protein [Hymenobacter sp. BT559]
MHLLDSGKEWNEHAHKYMKCFMDSDWSMYLSTIALAEWCVKGSMDELPMNNLQLIPFTASHAQRAGEFTALALKHRNTPPVEGYRPLVKNDTKLFAQADLKLDITHYLTSDEKSSKEIYSRIQNAFPAPRFKFISLCLPPEQTLQMKPIQRSILDYLTELEADAGE